MCHTSGTASVPWTSTHPRSWWMDAIPSSCTTHVKTHFLLPPSFLISLFLPRSVSVSPSVSVMSKHSSSSTVYSPSSATCVKLHLCPVEPQWSTHSSDNACALRISSGKYLLFIWAFACVVGRDLMHLYMYGLVEVYAIMCCWSEGLQQMYIGRYSTISGNETML